MCQYNYHSAVEGKIFGERRAILRCDIPVVYQITVWKMNMKNGHKHNCIIPL
jgi:hypothetical protein